MTPIDFKARAAAIAANLRQQGAAAFVGTRQACLHYLTGTFMPWRGAVVITADGGCEGIYWTMDSERARLEGAAWPITDFTGSGLIAGIVEVLKRHGAADGVVGLDLAHPGAAQIAPGMLTAAEYLELADALPQARLINGVRLIDDIMLIKSEAELERLRAAALAADAGFLAGLEAVSEGVTENHVAGQVEAAIRDHGSIFPWAVTGATEVGGGERTAYRRGVTQQASDRRLQRDEFIVIDLHSNVDLYLADLSLPVFFGKPSSEQQALIACWEDVVNTMLEGLRPGRRVAECAQAGIDAFKRHAVGEFGLPLFGHGLGTCARSRPFMNLSSDDVLAPNMVIALGTHIYQPGVGGMRLEYPVVVTEGGARSLGDLPASVHRLQ